MDNKKTLWRSIVPPFVMIAVIFITWELIVRLELVDRWLVPSPIEVLIEMGRGWERLSEHWLATLKLTMLGYVGGAVFGVLLGVLLHFIPIFRSAMYPVLVLSQNIPVIVIAPIITMLLGFSILPKVLLIVLVCFFPICIAMLSGLAQVDHNLRNYMGMIGSSRWQQFRHLELPNSISSLFSGLKIAATYSVSTAVVAEWLSPKVGLGGYMILSSRGYMPERVFAAVTLIVLSSLLLFWIVGLIEKLIVRWQPRKEAA